MSLLVCLPANGATANNRRAYKDRLNKNKPFPPVVVVANINITERVFVFGGQIQLHRWIVPKCCMVHCAEPNDDTGEYQRFVYNVERPRPLSTSPVELPNPHLTTA